MRFMTILIAGVITILLSSCTSRGQTNEVTIENPNQTATIYVFRDDSIKGVLANLDVTFQNKSIYGIGANEYIEFKIPTGEQVIGVKCVGGLVVPVPQHHQISFVSKSDETYYFLMTIPGGFNCAKIKQISDKEAKKWLQITRKQS